MFDQHISEKKKIFGVKNSLQGFNRRLDTAKERISKINLEKRSEEIIPECRTEKQQMSDRMARFSRNFQMSLLGITTLENTGTLFSKVEHVHTMPILSIFL